MRVCVWFSCHRLIIVLQGAPTECGDSVIILLSMPTLSLWWIMLTHATCTLRARQSPGCAHRPANPKSSPVSGFRHRKTLFGFATMSWAVGATSRSSPLPSVIFLEGSTARSKRNRMLCCARKQLSSKAEHLAKTPILRISVVFQCPLFIWCCTKSHTALLDGLNLSHLLTDTPWEQITLSSTYQCTCVVLSSWKCFWVIPSCHWWFCQHFEWGWSSGCAGEAVATWLRL